MTFELLVLLFGAAFVLWILGQQLHAYLKRRRRPAQLEAYATRLGWRFDATGRSFDFDQWVDFPQFFPRWVRSGCAS